MYTVKGKAMNPEAIYGKSAYEIAVMHGFNGTEEEWLDSLCPEKYYVTPQMFGAKGDGVTDDTDAFNSALRKGTSVFVPSGTYKVNGLNFHYFQNRIFGEGTATKICTSTSIKLVGCNNAVLENITFVPDAELESLMEIKSTYHAILDKVKFVNENGLSSVGVLCDSTDHSYYHSFLDCKFTGFQIGAKFTKNANRCTVTNCEFYLCGTCVVIDSCNGICISNNGFQSYTVCGVRFEYNNYGSITKGNIVTGNYFEFGSIENAVGHIDFSNNESCSMNTLIGNNYTYSAQVTKYANTENVDTIVLDADDATYNQNIELPAFVRQGVMPASFRSTYKSGKLGCITPFEEEDGSISFYANVRRSDGVIDWRKIPVYHNETELNLDRLVCSDFEQYWGGRIVLGTNGAARDKAVTFDNSYKLPKIYTKSKWIYFQLNESGSSSDRPSDVPIGTQYFDSSLGKPIWYNGSSWVDSTGTTV